MLIILYERGTELHPIQAVAAGVLAVFVAVVATPDHQGIPVDGDADASGHL